MWQCKWINLVDNFGTDASDITWYHDDQILNQLATNQNMHIWMKYKTDFKKYWKSEVAKYKSISIEIKQPERADLVDCVLAIMVLDVNFNNPWKAADFLFFDEKVDAKKIDNNVVKVKGCLIHVHEDINSLPPFPSIFL